nr:FKBP-type peptidyl-prolyl cis-trans isomerase [uncultured Marinifilum sp.]
MKRSSLILAFLAATVCFNACKKVPRTGKMNFTTVADSVSYALGFIEANNFKKTIERAPFQIDSLNRIHFGKAIAKTQLKKKYSDFRIDQFSNINEEAFYKGFLNEYVYGKSYFSEMSADVYLRKIFNQKKAEKDSVRKELAKVNLQKGQNFLEQNKKREGVKVTDSGLQYKILKQGSGKTANKTDRIKCVYHGTLIDGTVFDSSKERGDTSSFFVNRVIKGWTEALQIMPEGSEWRLFVPANLAYGERGSNNKIGPNEALIFDINLVEILEKKK